MTEKHTGFRGGHHRRSQCSQSHLIPVLVFFYFFSSLWVTHMEAFKMIFQSHFLTWICDNLVTMWYWMVGLLASVPAGGHGDIWRVLGPWALYLPLCPGSPNPALASVRSSKDSPSPASPRVLGSPALPAASAVLCKSSWGPSGWQEAYE